MGVTGPKNPCCGIILAMDHLDRIEANFRLSLLWQKETNSSLRDLSTRVDGLAAGTEEVALVTAELAQRAGELAVKVKENATGLSEVAAGLVQVADRGEATAARLEDSIEVMHSFARGQAELRKTVADCVKRLDALEAREAS